MKKGIVRNSNIELLRIISIFMITLSHYSVHNGVKSNFVSTFYWQVQNLYFSLFKFAFIY